MFDLRDHGGNFGGENVGKLNIYTQLSEPVKKEGIWIKTDQKYSKVINDLELWFANEWNDESLKTYADVPYSAGKFTAVAIGTDIYVMGGGSGVSSNYKYNAISNTWTQLADIPYKPTGHSAVAVGRKIYVMGGSGLDSQNYYYNYAYNIDTNTWTKLASCPHDLYTHTAVAIGTDIYVMGGKALSGSTANTNYKYNTLTDVWTQLNTPPVSTLTNHTAVAVGAKIYVMGGPSSGTNAQINYEYDTFLDTWTSKPQIPYIAIASKAVAIGTNVYLIGSSYTDTTYNYYMYDTKLEKWTKLTDVPYATGSHAAVYCDNGIYVMGFTGNLKKNIKYSFTSKAYPNGTLVVYRTQEYNGVYKTELITPKINAIAGVNTRLLSTFDNVYMYLSNKLQENLETYYGDGTKWVKFKGA